MAIWRLKPPLTATWKVPLKTATLSVCRLFTNPSLVFDNGVFHLASPKGQEHLVESPLEDQSSSFWSIDPAWGQSDHRELFFDQVAELEQLMSGENCREIVFQKSWPVNGALSLGSAQNKEDVDGSVELSDSEENLNAGGLSCPGPGISCVQSSEENPPPEQQALEHSPASLPNNESMLFDQSQDSPSSVGSSCSDEASEKRIRNNEASRKFRRARKERHKTLFAKATKLEKENWSLKLQVNEMMREIASLRSMLPKNINHVSFVS